MTRRTIIHLFSTLFKEIIPYKYKLPKKIKDYILVDEITKETTYNAAFIIAKYKKAQLYYFIKIWSYPLKDLNYFALKNEYTITRFLYKKMQFSHISKHIIPMVDVIENKYLAIISQFQSGKSLIMESKKKQNEILNKALIYIHKIDNSLTTKDLRYITTIPLSHYIFTLPLFTCFLVLLYPNKIKSILKAFFLCIKVVKTFTIKKYTLAHRDLDASNIIVDNNNFYITDWETTARTVPFYDMVRMSLLQKDMVYSSSDKNKLTFPEGIFLRNYILLHLAVSSFKSKKLVYGYLDQI